MTIALLMSVIAFCTNETSSVLLHVCLPALQGDDYARGQSKEEEKKSYLHFSALNFIRWKPRHRQAQRPSKIRSLSPRIRALVGNAAHKGKVTRKPARFRVLFRSPLGSPLPGSCVCFQAAITDS